MFKIINPSIVLETEHAKNHPNAIDRALVSPYLPWVNPKPPHKLSVDILEGVGLFTYIWLNGLFHNLMHTVIDRGKTAVRGIGRNARRGIWTDFVSCSQSVIAWNSTCAQHEIAVLNSIGHVARRIRCYTWGDVIREIPLVSFIRNNGHNIPTVIDKGIRQQVIWHISPFIIRQCICKAYTVNIWLYLIKFPCEQP